MADVVDFSARLKAKANEVQIWREKANDMIACQKILDDAILRMAEICSDDEIVERLNFSADVLSGRYSGLTD